MCRIRKAISYINFLLTAFIVLTAFGEVTNETYQLYTTSNNLVQDSTDQISKQRAVSKINCALISHKDDADAFTFSSEDKLCVTYKNNQFNMDEEINLAEKYHNFLATSCQFFRVSDYIVIDQKADWTTAKSQCEQRGCYLADLTNLEEQRCLSKLVLRHGTSRAVWIGGERNIAAGTFVWYHNDAIFSSELEWEPGQPNNYKGKQNCIDLYKMGSGYWMLNDGYCRYKSPFVCKC